MRIGLDVMGGDKAPEATIAGAILARKEFDPEDRLVLIGDQQVILEHLEKHSVNPSDFDIVHAPDQILMKEHPIKSFTNKPESSIGIGFREMAEKRLDAFASAGNSGAMLVGSIYTVNNVQGVIRPATSAVFPKVGGGYTVLLDVGTNPDAKPDVLYQFAILGAIYAEHLYGIKSPRVALLNIGEEETKGNVQSQSTYQLMKDTNDFNFIGNVEGRDLLTDKADVIVCDGFTGNVVLKQMEAMYHLLVKRGLTDEYIERFNYENYGGTPILGINSPVVIGHGISNDIAIKNMVIHSRDVAKAGLSDKIKYAMLHYSLNK
ncbi:MAG: phosphate acyltransferase PlsX [Bacteroidales bacterium]|nr:phosphate acyltransferase PlsX [Bacteroidales bacterium]